MKLKFEVQLAQLKVVENDPKLPEHIRKMISLIRKKQLKMEQDDTLTDEQEQIINKQMSEIDLEICAEIDEWKNFDDDEDEVVVATVTPKTETTSTQATTQTKGRVGRPKKEIDEEEQEKREAEELQKKLDKEKSERINHKNNPETKVNAILEKYGKIHFDDLKAIIGSAPGFSTMIGSIKLNNIPMTNYYSLDGK